MANDLLVTPARVRAARILAIAADFVQIVVFPVFAPGLASIVNDALDLAVAALMIVLVGWHWAFLPTFVAELVPLFDLVPTWSAAVFFATRNAGAKAPAPAQKAQGAIDAQVVSSSPVAKPESTGRSVV